MFPVALTIPPVNKLPPVILAVALTVPVVATALVVLLNVKPAVAFSMPPSLKITCVLAPGETKLPIMLPPVILPVADINPFVRILPPVTLPLRLATVQIGRAHV